MFMHSDDYDGMCMMVWWHTVPLALIPAVCCYQGGVHGTETVLLDQYTGEAPVLSPL